MEEENYLDLLLNLNLFNNIMYEEFKEWVNLFRNVNENIALQLLEEIIQLTLQVNPIEIGDAYGYCETVRALRIQLIDKIDRDNL